MRASATSSLYDATALLKTDYLVRLLGGPDSWLKACVLLLIAQLQEPKWLTEAMEHTHSPVSIIKETAEYAVYKLNVVR